MIKLLFTKHTNATNICTIVAINAIIFQNACLEIIDTAIGAFHSVAASLLTIGHLERHVDYILVFEIALHNFARL